MPDPARPAALPLPDLAAEMALAALGLRVEGHASPPPRPPAAAILAAAVAGAATALARRAV